MVAVKYLVVSHFKNFYFPSFLFWCSTYLSVLISGDQGEILGVVSESEKSFDDDLQHASLEAEKLAIDIEEFQVSLWSFYLFCCYLFFCCVCIFCSRVFLLLPLRCLFLGRKILMGIMELKAVLSFRVAWLKVVYHILIWTVFLQIGLDKPPSIL